VEDTYLLSKITEVKGYLPREKHLANRIAIELIIKNFWVEPQWRDPFRILISCIVSQRTRSEITRYVVKELFTKYRDISDLAKADPRDLERILRPAGLFREKAIRIIEASKYILEKFSGEVPDSLEELLKIPGIGRKCANIVLAYAFNKPAIAVDANVLRISKRIGIVDENAKPLDVEKTLAKIVPKNYWRKINISMVRFGREICKPKNPRCDTCFISNYCNYYKRIKSSHNNS